MNERETENVRIARLVPEDIASEGELDLIDEVYAEDAVEHGPFEESIGRAAIKAVMHSYREAFPDFSATVEDVVASGDTVAMRVRVRGTHDGEFLGREPTHKSFDVGNMVFTRIEDGRIIERWLQPDTLEMFQQIGALPDDLSAGVAPADD